MVARPAFRWLAVLAVAVTAAASLSACSSGGSTGPGSTNLPTSAPLPTGIPTRSIGPNVPAQAIVKAMFAETKAATAFKVVSTTTRKIKTTSGTTTTTTTVAMHYGNTDSSGTITIDKVPVDFIRVGVDNYVKASDAFWQTQLVGPYQSRLSSVHDKWVKNPTVGATLLSLLSYTQKAPFMQSLASGKAAPTYLRGADKTISGLSAVSVIDQANSRTLYIESVHNFFLLEVDSSAAGEPSKSVFTDWDASFTVTAPPAKDVFVFA
jgi:hypothetical protein